MGSYGGRGRWPQLERYEPEVSAVYEAINLIARSYFLTRQRAEYRLVMIPIINSNTVSLEDKQEELERFILVGTPLYHDLRFELDHFMICQ